MQVSVSSESYLFWCIHCLQKYHNNFINKNAILQEKKAYFFIKNPMIRFTSREDKNPLFELIFTYDMGNKEYTSKLFVIQKHCMRILFGDYKAYLDKFKTCARTRPIEDQKLGHDFYMREHTKPLFFKMGILSYGNLYNYHMCLETLKILKSRLPSCLYGCFNVSSRNMENILLYGNCTYGYFHNSVKIWNQFVKILAKSVSLPSIRIAKFKRDLKSVLLQIQNAYDCIEWFPENVLVETATKLLRDGKITL